MEIRKVYLTVLLLNLSNELLNMGLIVWAGTQSNEPIQRTAWVAFWTATGYILAIFLNLGDRLRVSSRTLLLTTIGASSLVFLFPQMSALWGVAILIRNAIGQVTYARFATVLPEFVGPYDIPKVSKHVQLAGTLGNAGSMLLSPHLATQFGITGIFITSLALIVITYLITFNSEWLSRSILHTQPIAAVRLASYGWFNFIAMMLVITWALYGTFFVIEIPLLQNRLQATPSIISLILFLNFLSNLLTTKFIPENRVDNNPLQFFFVSCIGLTVFTLAYLHSYTLTTIIMSVFLLGIFNSAMNFSVFLTIQKNKSKVTRESLFLGYRLATELGILGGIILVYFMRQPESAVFGKLVILSIVVLTSQTIVGLFLFCSTIRRRHGAKS